MSSTQKKHKAQQMLFVKLHATVDIPLFTSQGETSTSGYKQPGTLRKTYSGRYNALTMKYTILTLGVAIGLTRAPQDAPSLLTIQGAAWVSLHIIPPLVIAPTQQLSC